MLNVRAVQFYCLLMATFSCSAELSIPKIEIGRLMTTPESRVELGHADNLSAKAETAVTQKTGGESFRNKPLKVFGVVTSDHGNRHVWVNQPGTWRQNHKNGTTALAHTDDSVLVLTTQGKVQVKVGKTLQTDLTTVESYLNQ